MHKPLLFSTQSYRELARQIDLAGSFEPAEVEVRTFPDGERYQRVLSDCLGRDTVLVGGTISDSDTLELFDLACELANCSRSLTIVIPFFGYSTMERSVKRGEVVTAKTRCRVLSAIPSATMGNHVVFLDLHTEGIPHYLEGGFRHHHLYAKPAVIALCRELGGSEFVLASTDAGRMGWVESLAHDMDVGVSFVLKKRLDGANTKVMAVQALVEGQDVVIYDDMIRTGGSLLKAAEAYRDAGARSVSAVATHGVLPGDALERLRSSGLFRKIATTDSHPRALELQGDFLKVKSVGGLIAEHLKESLSF